MERNEVWGILGPVLGVVLALGVLSPNRSVTVYPALSCSAGCDYIDSAGHTYKARQVMLPTETYTAVPERQDVVVQTGSLVTSFTNEGYECAVANARNWRCQRKSDGFGEAYAMSDGDLSHYDPNSSPSSGTFTFYTTYCHSWQIALHNSGLNHDEKPSTDGTAPSTASMALFWLTGCLL